MGETTVAGILIERRRAYLVLADLLERPAGRWPKLKILASESYTLDREDKEETFKVLEKVLDDATTATPAILSVGAFGPFVSLDREKIDKKADIAKLGSSNFEKSVANRYGRVDPAKGNRPLKGEPLYAIFRNWLDQRGHGGTEVYIDTDANACALGEAFLRKLSPGKLLVYLLVTEGVGVGLVNGLRIVQSALHPEIGLLPVRYLGTDKSYSKHPFAGDLGLLASTASVAERLGNPFITNEDVIALGRHADRKMWRLQAYYLAQACMACTVILAPHKVVVATDIDPDGRIVERVRKAVAYFRRSQRQLSPAFSYRELDKADFIDAPYVVDLKDRSSEFGPFYTGAVGMAVKASMMLGRTGVTSIPTG